MKKNTLVYSVLVIVLLCGYFMLIGSYPLLDVDETRYVEIARTMIKNNDFMTLYLNGEYFFEKPPLYFWLECLAFKTFGGVNELIARLPIILLSLLPLGLLFGLCKKVKNIRFALITSCVLLTSLEYVLITKIAILDSVCQTKFRKQVYQIFSFKYHCNLGYINIFQPVRRKINYVYFASVRNLFILQKYKKIVSLALGKIYIKSSILSANSFCSSSTTFNIVPIATTS